MIGEKSYGMSLDYLNYWPALKPLERYGISKAGNWLHGDEFAKRYRADGVVSIPCKPGHLRSDLYRDSGILFKAVLNSLITYPPINGAYTEIFAGLSPTITIQETGDWGEFLTLFRSLTDLNVSGESLLRIPYVVVCKLLVTPDSLDVRPRCMTTQVRTARFHC